MQIVPPPPAQDEVFTLEEVARAAGGPTRHVRTWVQAENIEVVQGFVRRSDAVSLVQRLATKKDAGRDRTLLFFPTRRRKAAMSLFTSGTLHIFALIVLVWLASR